MNSMNGFKTKLGIVEKSTIRRNIMNHRDKVTENYEVRTREIEGTMQSHRYVNGYSRKSERTVQTHIWRNKRMP